VALALSTRTASGTPREIRREMTHYLVIRRDDDGYCRVVRGNEKCRCEDWIESVPNLTDEEK
jgi:hypothetical protein